MKLKKLMKVAVCTAVVLAMTACGAKIQSVSLPETIEMKVGETAKVEITYDAGDASTEETAAAAEKLTLEWATGDPAVATVDQTGIITAVAGGETELKVASKDGKLAAATKIVVKVPLESVEADDIELTTIDKATKVEYKLVPENAEAGEVEIISADEAVIKTVGTSIQPAGEGETTITIKSGEIEKTVKVVVKQAPVELSAEPVTVQVGKTATIEVSTGLEDGKTAEVGTNYTYKSADESIATVDETGNVTGVAEGETEIVIENELGQKTNATVTVEKAAASKPTTSGKTNSSTNTGSNSASASTPTGGATTTPSDSGRTAPATTPTPSQPSQPEQPAQPSQPSTPAEPSTPSQPSQPESTPIKNLDDIIEGDGRDYNHEAKDDEIIDD